MSKTERLSKFVSFAQNSLRGDEKGEAQVFLDRLFQAFGHAGCFEAGATLEFRVKKESQKGTSFADLVWKPRLLVEMKKRGENLAKHYRQAFDYWARLVPQRPRWVVLCNFDEFWVYDFETQMDAPRAIVKLESLPTGYGPLAFLFVEEEPPVFDPDSKGVTQKAASVLADCFNSLIGRNISREVAQKFTMQMLTALFAQNIGLLERYTVTRILDDCRRPKDSFDLLGQLFTEMNTPGKTEGGRFTGVGYFNGGLFAIPSRIELTREEISLLRMAAASDWSQVRPEIFGTLFEHSLGDSERHMTGAHFTSPADIMKIVGPTIVEPWSELIESAKTQKALHSLHARMQHYKVLDPACGSGNFLYIAYRELKRLEFRIWERVAELSTKEATAQQQFGFVTAAQFYGIDKSPFAVELAKVTMMIGRKLAIDELQITEHALPLDNLDRNFSTIDAIVSESGGIPAWQPVDAIIGNPPFLDARKLTMEHGRDYAGRLRRAYPEIPGRADYCVYWFRRAHDAVPQWSEENPVSGRIGLVGTNSIRQNYSRMGGLDYITDHGGSIVNAVTSQVWSGVAAVNVSIVNWVKGPYEGPRILQEQIGDRRDSEWTREVVRSITSALTSRTDVSDAKDIRVVTEKKFCFEGQQPGHKGFRFELDQYLKLTKRDKAVRDIVFQYMIGNSLLSGRYLEKPEFIIDFGNRTILEAQKHPDALALVKDAVLSDWQENAEREGEELGSESGEHQRRVKVWWKLKRRRSDMLEAIAPLSRYIVCVRHTKRPIFTFLDSSIRPDSALTVFAFEDDYSFGILQSDVHWQWFTARCSSLTRRFRYTNETVFDSFPWPQSPTKSDIKSIVRSARALRDLRASAMDGAKGGLRALYKSLDDNPGTNPLREAHQQLDLAVCKAYGFSTKKDILAQTLDLNCLINESADAVGPGIPPIKGSTSDLVSKDCIRPYWATR